MLKKIAFAALATAGILAASASQGCGSSTPSCDDSCKCQGKEGDAKCLDACQKALDDESAAATKNGCQEQYDDYESCIGDNVVCEGGVYGVPVDRCTAESAALCTGKCNSLDTCKQ